MRSKFGWDLPPGCTHRQIDEAYGQEGPCAVCGKSVDLCICPECPVCEAQGDPKCYLPANELSPGHNMKLTKEQAISRQKARMDQLMDRMIEEGMYLGHLESSEQNEYDISEIPDPWR